MRSRVLLFLLGTAAFSHIAGCVAPTSGDDGEGAASSEEAVIASWPHTSGFKSIPSMTAAHRAAILSSYASIPHQGIRQALYESAILYYDTNVNRIANKHYLSVVDFAKSSGHHRFYVLDM